mmetsp:Transcript_33334/g.95471  ORF Transcript_33334/g.95471 Transcript_33334/m.95471 type:complete len:257 (+) Transcript_33334:150-920(+)
MDGWRGAGGERVLVPRRPGHVPSRRLLPRGGLHEGCMHLPPPQPVPPRVQRHLPCQQHDVGGGIRERPLHPRVHGPARDGRHARGRRAPAASRGLPAPRGELLAHAGLRRGSLGGLLADSRAGPHSKRGRREGMAPGLGVLARGGLAAAVTHVCVQAAAFAERVARYLNGALGRGGAGGSVADVQLAAAPVDVVRLGVGSRAHPGFEPDVHGPGPHEHSSCLRARQRGARADGIAARLRASRAVLAADQGNGPGWT